MSYVIEILNTSDNSTWSKVAQLHAGECTCRVNRRLNEDWLIEVNYIIPPDGQGDDKSAYLLSWNTRLRIKNIEDSTDYQTFLVTRTNTQKSSGGQISLAVSGLHIALMAMQNIVINASYDFQNMTPLQIWAVLQANHLFEWGDVVTCSIPDLLSIFIGWETIASAHQKIAEACRAEVDFTESDRGIVLYAYGAMGSTTKYIHIRPERNMKGVSLQKYSRDVVNKVYGVGGGSPPSTIAGARHVVYSVVGQVVTVDHNKLVPENDSWNTNYKAKFVTGALAGSSFTISDCAHGTTRDTLTLTGTLTGAAVGDKIVITTAAGVEVNFIRAGVSIASYGTVEGVYQNAEHGSAVNLVETPFFDGTYTGGLCANWTKNGTPTCTENTDRAYIQHGSKSQKVVGGADADGIYQNISGLTAGRYYRIRVNVWLEGSTPTSKINVYLGSAPAIALYASDIESDATGRWVSFDWWGQAGATTTRITVLQSGTQSATFYVDAVQLAECPTDESQNLTANCEALDLWKETFDFIMKKKDPLVEYRCNFVDLNRMDPIAYPNEKINLGDTVLITDNNLGISAVSARVKEISFDPFRPEFTEHTVSNL